MLDHLNARLDKNGLFYSTIMITMILRRYRLKQESELVIYIVRALGSLFESPVADGYIPAELQHPPDQQGQEQVHVELDPLLYPQLSVTTIMGSNNLQLSCRMTGLLIE